MDSTNRSFLSRLLSSEWPYWAGGVAIALVNTAILAVQGRPWGVTGPVTNLGGKLLQGLGLHPEAWAYFRSPDVEQGFLDFDLWNGVLWINLGIILGVAISSLSSGEFRLRFGRRGWRTAALALGGGLLMGYGTRLSQGCNAGALLGGIPSFSLHGWVFLVTAAAGIVIGLRLFWRSL